MIYPTGTELTCRDLGRRYRVIASDDKVTLFSSVVWGLGRCNTVDIVRHFSVSQIQGDAALVPNSRLLELIRGYVAANSTPTTLPDMGAEHHLLKLAQLVVDEAKARLALRSLE